MARIFNAHRRYRSVSACAYHWIDHDFFDALTAFLTLLMDRFGSFDRISISEQSIDNSPENREARVYKRLEDIQGKRELLGLLNLFKKEFDRNGPTDSRPRDVSTFLSTLTGAHPQSPVHAHPYDISTSYDAVGPFWYDRDGTVKESSMEGFVTQADVTITYRFNDPMRRRGSGLHIGGEYAKKNVDTFIDLIRDMSAIFPEGDLDPIAYIRPVWRFIPLKDFDAAAAPENWRTSVETTHDILTRLRKGVPREPILEVLESSSIEFKELPNDRVYVRFGETWDDLPYDYRAVFRDVKKAVLPELKEVGLR